MKNLLIDYPKKWLLSKNEIKESITSATTLIQEYKALRKKQKTK